MADRNASLERALADLLPAISGIVVEVREDHVEIRCASRDPFVLANLIQQRIDIALGQAKRRHSI